MLSTAHRRRIFDHIPTPEPPSEGKPLRVAVLMGGVGYEREVSLVSGAEVAKALVARGHDVTRCVLDDDDERALNVIPSGVDVAFLALHGQYGEDGTIQQSLARRNITYTGSGPEASARAFDKLRAKRLFARAGLPLAWQRVLEFPFTQRSVRHAVRMTPPSTAVVVKPISAGSSVGVVVCRNQGELQRALEEGARYRQHLMIEEFIPGRELTCGILDDRPLPVVEAVPERAFFDYRAKYDKGTGTQYVVEPEEIAEEIRDKVRRFALTAHDALGCSEFSRADFRYDPQQERVVLLEVNTIPGLTPTSLLPKAAAAVGIPFDALCEHLCRLAIRTAVR